MAFPYWQQPTFSSFPQMYQPQQTSIIWVSGEQEAQSYPVAPNNAVALWDSNGSAIYLKQTDASGKPSVKAYDLVERTQKPVDSVSAPNVKLPDFATKDEMKALTDAVDALKSDVAKVRKAMKKKEEDDDE